MEKCQVDADENEKNLKSEIARLQEEIQRVI